MTTPRKPQYYIMDATGAIIEEKSFYKASAAWAFIDSGWISTAYPRPLTVVTTILVEREPPPA